MDACAHSVVVCLKMKRATPLPLCCVAVLLSVLCFDVVRKGCDTFALSKQVGSHVLREREGLGIHDKAGRQFDWLVNETDLVVKLTPEEKNLAALLKDEGNKKNGNWQKLLAKSNYTGDNPVVLTAAMQAALNQREPDDYDQGFKIYKRLRYMTLPTYTLAMKLLGKLGEVDEVERLWDQLVELGLVNDVLASARIDAAADNGDIQGAVRVLDYIKKHGLEPNLLHYTNAIKACANAAEGGRAKEAQKLFDAMVAEGIQPNIVTYSNLLRAFRKEPSQCHLHILADMKDRNVKANNVFAETFLFIFLKQPRKGCWMGQEAIVADIRKLELADLETAERFINELRGANVKLSRACKLIDAALRDVLKS